MEPFSADLATLWKEQLRSIPDDFIRSITNFSVLQSFDVSYKPACIQHYNGMIFSTSDHQTYAYGEEICYLLQLSHKDGRPQLISDLDGKTIKQVVMGSNMVAILTEDGLVYLYGCAQWRWRPKASNPLVAGNDDRTRFKQIAGGLSHLLLLTTDHRLMAMGSNQFGQIAAERDSFGSLVQIDLKHVQKIDCGAKHSLALCRDGRIFSWGFNRSGCLGLGHKHNQNRPRPIKYFHKIKIGIQDFVAYRSHTLFLLNDGSVYGCGSEEHWQLGSRYLGYNEPEPIPLPMNDVERIAPAAWSHDFSMVLTKNQTYHVWGKLKNLLIHGMSQTIRPVSSFSEASSLYLRIPLTFGWTAVSKPKPDYRQKLTKSIGNMFDNPLNHDFVFCFEDGRKIFAQRHYLKNVSEYLNKLLSEDWCDQSSVEIKYNSYEVFYQYIRLLHFGTIEIRPKHVAELLDLAECSLDETLADLCEEFMMETLNEDNCQIFHRLAVSYHLENLGQKIQQEYPS